MSSWGALRLAAGHITAGGSVCIEVLTNSGTDGSWRPTLSVESVLRVRAPGCSQQAHLRTRLVVCCRTLGYLRL